MEDALMKPDIVLVTKNLMVPMALPAPENKFFPAPRTSRKKTTIVRARKSRLSPGRAIRSGENAMPQTNLELLRSSDYIACDYGSLVDWEQDLHDNYELPYSKGLVLGEAGFGDSRSEGNGRLDYLSQSFPERCETFSSIHDGKDRNSDRAEGKEMLFGGSGQTGIELGEEKNDLGEKKNYLEISAWRRDSRESFDRCGKGHTFDESQTKGNKKQNCSSRNIPEHCKAFSSTNDEKDKISDGPEGNEMLFGGSRQIGIDLWEEKNDLGILTRGRDSNENFNRRGKGRTFDETQTKGNKKQNCSSRNFPEHCKNFSSTNDREERNADEAEDKEMPFGGSGQTGIELGKQKNDLEISTSEQDYNESFNLCAKGHALDGTETKGNKKQNCLSQSFSEHYKTLSLKNDEKYNISDGAEGKEMLFGCSRQRGLDLGEEKNKLGISTSGRDYNESFNRCGKGSTLGVTISGVTETEGNKKQMCLSQSFPARSMAATIGTKICKTSLLSAREDNGKEETDSMEITSGEPTENELKIFDANIRWKTRERSTTELRRCASSASSLERPESFGSEADKGPKMNECEMKYSWQDLENWVPPSAKKRIAEIDERSDLTGAKKLDCKITYSWQIIGTGAQTSCELIRSLLTSAEEGEGKRAEEAANYPCAVKYSWQIIGTGTQVSFRRDNEDSLPIDGGYWSGKIVKPRKRFVEGSKDGSGTKTGSRKILYSEMTQTVIDESHQTELGDCRAKYSWQNLTKPYLEKIRRI